MTSPKKILKPFVLAALASAAMTSCSVSPDGPAMSGASHGALGSQNMSDYYYLKQAGWTYTFSNVEKVYASDNSTVAATYTGANDAVTTMGFDGYAPNGDSIFRYQVSYRILTQYAGRNMIDLKYIPSTQSDRTHGAWVEPGYIVSGATSMTKRPRPVSTDTILAGIAGRIRTLADDFTNSGQFTWQMDTLWCSSHLDSVFIWERLTPGGPMVKERCVFTKDFANGNSDNDGNVSWTYDLINNPTTTTCVVSDPNLSWTVPAGTYGHTAKIRIKTSEVDDKDFNREWKYYACGVGPVMQYDWFYVTTDGINFTKEDFTRSLISLTHN